MEQRIHGHFREAQCMMVISEKPVAFVVKIAKNLSTNTEASTAPPYLHCLNMMGENIYVFPCIVIW
jgi:hypothetical protein